MTSIAMPVGFGACGDTAPSGRYVCNLAPLHSYDHTFYRDGEPVATWGVDFEGTRAGEPQQLLDGPPSVLAGELRTWWLELAGAEAERVVPKAVEYGATDLRDIGRDLAAISGRKVTDEEATELGIYFYLRGKLSRWTDAVIRGDRPSDDTLHDLGVYVRMAQRTRSHGGWPGIKNKETAE